jgi:predicted lysophospholipase L1 biosynthesis ABC-type transport system permease subunit
MVSPAFFAVMGTRLIAGRAFSGADARAGVRQAVVNPAFARALGIEGNPVGSRIVLLGPNRELQIIGLAQDMRSAWMKGPPPPQVFVSGLEDPAQPALAFYVRSALPGEELARQVRALAASLDPSPPVYGMQSMRSQIDERMLLERFLARFSGVFAAVAILLAAVGLCGVMAYFVSTREHEIGMRAALGAGRSRLLGLVMGRAIRIAAGGLIAGFALAAAGRLLRSMLDRAGANPLLAPLAAAAFLLAVVTLAAWLPARRAAATDPAGVLRR